MNDLTLESAEEAFRQWREQRSSRKESIPEALWSMALGLYPQYMCSKICQHLRLGGSQFKRRLEDSGAINRAKGFVLASREEVKATSSVSSVQLTLQGQTRAMTLCCDVHALGEILPHVGALL